MWCPLTSIHISLLIMSMSAPCISIWSSVMLYISWVILMFKSPILCTSDLHTPYFWCNHRALDRVIVGVTQSHGSKQYDCGKILPAILGHRARYVREHHPGPTITSKNDHWRTNYQPKSSTSWGNTVRWTFTDPLKTNGLIISLFPQRPAQTVTPLRLSFRS